MLRSGGSLNKFSWLSLCSIAERWDCLQLKAELISTSFLSDLCGIFLYFHGQLPQNLSVLTENGQEQVVLLSLRVTTKTVCKIVSA